MKIQVIKRGDSKIKKHESCPWLVEAPPEAAKQ